jgi:phage tail sheath protein FI
MTGRAPASPVLNAPGVSVEWAGPLFRQLDGLRSDVTGFVGFALRGPVDHALRLASASEFDQVYGPPLDGSFLAPAVHGFFTNGGVTCWLVRAVDRQTATAAGADVSTDPPIRVKACSPGTWGNGITVQMQPAGGGRLTVTVTAPDGRRELWRNLDEQALRDHFSADSMSAESASALVSIELGEGAAVPAAASRTVLSGGCDGLGNVTPAHLTGDETISPPVMHGAALLADIEEIGLVAIPDLVVRDPSRAAAAPARAMTACPGPREPAGPGTSPASPAGPAGLPAFNLEQIASAQAQLVGDCQALQRTALLHHPDPDALADDAVRWRNYFNSAYAALYWPWLQTPDPARPSQVIAVPPSGHVAGVVARSDWSAGPHKPPANELVATAVGLTRRVDDEDHARVNSAGVNVIRSVAGRGIRVLGARTMSNEPQWRYLNVRRLLSQIERSVAAYAAWVVFEPDAEALHDDVERIIRQFLDELWRSGALEGSTAEQAYSVAVEDAAAGGDGRLVVEIGVQPPWPAEFVVVRIDVTEPGARNVAGGGFRGGVNG